jgi:3'-phosphoadenosine 5'-phosphosulfate sulfotransferase (PAPS reductase)/FAD synthetase
LDIDKAIRVEKQKGINANQELITKYEYDRKLLQDDYEFQKKYGVTGGKSYDPGAAVKTANLIKSLDDEKLALRTEQSELLGVLTGDRTAEQKQRIKEIEVRLGSRFCRNKNSTRCGSIQPTIRRNFDSTTGGLKWLIHFLKNNLHK